MFKYLEICGLQKGATTQFKIPSRLAWTCEQADWVIFLKSRTIKMSKPCVLKIFDGLSIYVFMFCFPFCDMDDSRKYFLTVFWDVMLKCV